MRHTFTSIFFKALLCAFIVLGCSKSTDNIENEPSTGEVLDDGPIVTIGLVSDIQYGDFDSNGSREFRKSIEKLENAVNTFNSEKVDFVQTLGDIIDKRWESFDKILPVFEDLNGEIEIYHLLGNHDFDIEPEYVPNLLNRLQMPNQYYSYTIHEWRFVVLDATDHSFYTNPFNDEAHREQTTKFYDAVYGKPNDAPHNGAIGYEQQDWLRGQLSEARERGEKVILFSHMPLRPLNVSSNLWNNGELRKLLKEYPNTVKLYINGHRNFGDYVRTEGVDYISMRSMVGADTNAYAIMKIYDDRIEFEGYGDQKGYSIKL